MPRPTAVLSDLVKHIGFLSFGHWSDGPGSQVRSAADSLLQSVELAEAAEELGGTVGSLRGQAARVCRGHGGGVYQPARGSAMRAAGMAGRSR